MNHPILLILVKVTIFSLMLAIGVNLSIDKLIALWRRPDLLFRALLAVIVLVPLVVILLLKLFTLSINVSTGLALLAVCPGAPLMSKRLQMAGVSIFHAAGLQLTLALVAVLFTPLTLDIFQSLFTLETQKVAVLDVSSQIFTAQLLPIGLGLIIQKFLPQVTLKIAQPLNLISSGLFLTLVVLLLIPALGSLLQIGLGSLIAIILMVLASLGIGHLLGGPDLEKRSALAIACIARNVGLALFIAILNNVEKLVLPTLISYAILGAIIAIPYSQWSKREIAKQQ
jgi:bile acid:Na+ symporter, BASS family